MPQYPFIVYALMQGSVFVFYTFTLASAARKGLQWVITLIYGSLFGLTIEVLCVNGANPAYHYATDKFLCFHDAPIWVALGWGIVQYACTRTAQKLTFKSNWTSELLWRPLTAGYLAVSIDVTLDPIAQAFGFWTWHCDCLLLSANPKSCPVPCPPGMPYDLHLLRYFDVPFDNFVGGWFGITATYSLSVFLGSWIHELLTKSRRVGAEPLHQLFRVDGAKPRGQPAWEQVMYLLITPLITLGGAVFLFWKGLRPMVQKYYAAHLTDGQLHLCIAAFLVAGFATAHIALLTDRDGKIDWSVLWVPIFFHGVPILLLFGWGISAQPALFLNVPANLALSLVLFTWPFQIPLIDRARGLAKQYEDRGGIVGLVGALFNRKRLTST